MRFLDFEDVIRDASSGNTKVQKGDYLSSGKFPIIDQGQDFIGGFTEDADNLVTGEGPWIVFGDHTRALKFVESPFCMGADGVKVLRLKDRKLADLKYVYHFLVSANIPSAGYSRHYKFLKRLQIPLPPLDEQKRIAAILDKADQLRQKRRQAIALLDSLTQSIFLEMFGDPVSNPKGWPTNELIEVADFYSGNSLPPAVEFIGQENGYLLLKVSDLNRPENMEQVNVAALFSDKQGSRAGTAPIGAVVFPKRGGAIATNKKRKLGRPAILDPNLMGVAPVRQHLTSDFLFGWFRFLNLASISSGSSVPQLNKQDLAPLQMHVPPLQLQQEYGMRIAGSAVLSGDSTKTVAMTESLFASLQHRAFTGQL